MQRNIKVDILPPDQETRKKVLDTIRLYQAACRKAYSWCATAEMAGAEISLVNKEGEPDVRVLPVTERSKKIMELISGKENKGTFYQIRTLVHELHPSWMSLVSESIEHDIVPKKWMAKDIEFPEAKRGYLTLNGAREFARFSRIGIHFKNTVIKADERSVTLKWDKDIGPVTFKVIDMDPSRWGVWRNLCSGTEGWKFSCMYLQEDEAKLRLVVSYTCPDKDQVLDTSKPLYVEFGTTPELYITMRTDQVYKGDVLSVVGALEWRKEMEVCNSYKKSDEI